MDDIKVCCYSSKLTLLVTDCSQVRGTGKTFDALGPSIYAEFAELHASNRICPSSQHDSVSSVYFDKIGWRGHLCIDFVAHRDRGERAGGGD